MTTTSATSSSSSTAATAAATTTSSASTTKAQNGSAILTALNAGSGIDTGSLVTNLSSATFAAKEQALTTKTSANTAQISSLGGLTAKIDAFASALTSLISGGTLSTQVTASDTTVLSATAQPGASLSGLSAQIEVTRTAQAQSLVSAPVAAAGTAIGTGSLTLTTPAGTSTITLDPTNNTLAGVARAINAAGAGVTASVVTDATGARLAVKGATGAANTFTLAAGGDADGDLQDFASGITTAQAAQDAVLRVDGVTVTRSSNKITDVVPGVTLNLAAARPGSLVSLSASVPTDAIGQAVNDFVSAYNDMKADLATATAAPSGSTAAGPLYGNAAIQQMQRQLARLSSTALNTSGGPSSLAEIGVSTNLDGTLAVNSSALNAALQNDPDAVEAMFNPTQHSDNPLIRITSAMGIARPGTYAVANASPQSGSTNASATIAGVAGLPTLDGSGVYASVGSAASGLQIQPQGAVASATVTVDPGLGGALQAIRDALRAKGGILDALSTQLTDAQNDLSDQRTKLSADESAYQDRLTSQFSAMNTRVTNYKSIQSYLTQQIAAWNKSDNN